MKKTWLLLSLVAVGLLTPAWAQEAAVPSEDPTHEELRTLRREMVEAINRNNLDALLSHLDENIAVTWMDGRVSRGRQAVREYVEKMTKGEDRIVTSYKTEAEVDELTHLYGDTGVAFGHSHDQFVLTDGQDFTVETRWTATLVKKEGAWKLAAFHASAGVFDNPVLQLAVRRTAIWTGGIAAIAGLALGAVAVLVTRRRG